KKEIFGLVPNNGPARHTRQRPAAAVRLPGGRRHHGPAEADGWEVLRGATTQGRARRAPAPSPGGGQTAGGLGWGGQAPAGSLLGSHVGTGDAHPSRGPTGRWGRGDLRVCRAG